jgi:hypothetical protein
MCGQRKDARISNEKKRGVGEGGGGGGVHIFVYIGKYRGHVGINNIAHATALHGPLPFWHRVLCIICVCVCAYAVFTKTKRGTS